MFGYIDLMYRAVMGAHYHRIRLAAGSGWCHR